MASVDNILYFTAGVYSIVAIVLAIALALYRPSRVVRSFPFISVVIAARNELTSIRHCLEALTAQDFDADAFEVIVVDDRSEDLTASVAESYRGRIKHLTVIRIAETPIDVAPKKHALAKGIQASRGGIILCTDADCRPDRGWVRAMVAHFREDTGMVIGFSPVDPRSVSLLHHFAALDSLSLASVAASTCALAIPLTAAGRSLAYRRQTFNDVGGFDSIAHLISGDDDLLLQLVRRSAWKVAYCIDPSSLVSTDPPASWQAFAAQRVRHASKGRHYTAPVVVALALLYLFNVSLVVWTPISLMSGNPGPVWAWFLKAASEFVLVGVGAIRLGRGRFLAFFPVMAFFHPWYVSVFGLWGQFGKFTWKNRLHDRVISGA